MLYMKMKNQSCVNSKWMKFGAFLSELCGIFLIVYSFVTVIVDRGMNFSTLETLLAKAFPVWCAADAGRVFYLHISEFEKRESKKSGVCRSVCALVFVTYASLFPVSPYSFTSDRWSLMMERVLILLCFLQTTKHRLC